MTSSTKLKDGYFTHSINTKFMTKPMFNLMYMPMQKGKYRQLKEEAGALGIEVDWSVGMIEQSKFIGNGWIGVAHPSGTKEINQEFIAYKYVGAYKTLAGAYKKVMKDYPQAQSFYSLYMTDPEITADMENVTYILFASE